MNPFDIIKGGVVTEKSTSSQAMLNKYSFKVDPRASKTQIKKMFENMFGVRVATVRTMNFRGKQRRIKWYEEGRKANWKKAIITLREGEKIELVKE